MRSHGIRGVIGALALALAPALAGGAETIGVLAVSDPPGPSAELVEITLQFRGVLTQAASGVLEPADLRQRMMGQTSTASLTELERAFAGAVATYQAGDYQAAIETLRAVIADLEKLPDGPDAFRQWTRAMIRLARSEQTVGRRAEAEDLLERVVRADPQVRVDTAQYPPSFARQVDEVRAKLAKQATRKLSIDSSQKGARVYVDGRDVGLAPVVVSLAPGTYRITGVLQELRAPPIRADLTEDDQNVRLDFSIAEALRPGAGPGLALGPQDRAGRIITVAASLGLDRAVVTAFVHEGDVTYLQGTLYDVRRGSSLREGRLRLAGKAPPSGGLTALASFLMTGQPSQLVAQAAAPGPGKKAKEDAKPKREEPDLRASEPKPQHAASESPLRPERPAPSGGSALLRWSPVVSLALAAGLGTYAGLQARSASSQYATANELLVGSQLMPGVPPSTYNRYVSDGDSARSRAIMSGAGAGVAVVATGVLGYISYKRTGEIGPFRF